MCQIQEEESGIWCLGRGITEAYGGTAKDKAKQFFNNPKVQDGLATVLSELVYAGFAKKRRRDHQMNPSQ